MLKILLVLLFLLADVKAVLARVQDMEHGALVLVYGSLYAGLAGSLVLVGLLRNTPARILLGLILSGAAALQYAFEWTAAGPFTYGAFRNMLAATSQLDAALAEHGRTILLAGLASGCLFASIALPARRHLPARWALPLPLVGLAVLSLLLYTRGGEGSRGLPAAYPPIAFASLLLVETAISPNRPREQPHLRRTSRQVPGDIVLIVDESVVGQYLDINHRAGVRSGLLEKRPGIRVANFGYASAISKCSANSNVVLRFGGTPTTFWERFDHGPSLWRYAEAAGLRTVYLDGQLEGGRLQNLMTPAERQEIDDFVQFDGTSLQDRDMAVADALRARLNNDRHEFILVNKLGAHFPIADKYPDAFHHYRPALPRGMSPAVSWTSDRQGFGGSAADWVQYRNAYRNTLTWNVGAFFDRLLGKARLGRATILYTSDHGQDLHERHNPGNNTHCGAGNAAPEEGIVPLVVIESAAHKSLDWVGGAKLNHNQSSAFRIFPTLLALMGYDRQAMHPLYGVPLDVGHTDWFAYNVDYTAPLLGRPPNFRTINPKNIAAPPLTDIKKQVDE